MRTIGDRLSVFDDSEFQTVEVFNKLFDEVPLKGYKGNEVVVIGEITANATTRELLINNIATEHSFVRRTSSENDFINFDDIYSDDDDWVQYFQDSTT